MSLSQSKSKCQSERQPLLQSSFQSHFYKLPIELLEHIAQDIPICDIDNYIDVIGNYNLNSSNYKYLISAMYKVKIKQIFNTTDIDTLILYVLMFCPRHNKWNEPGHDAKYISFGMTMLPLPKPDEYKFLVDYLRLISVNGMVVDFVSNNVMYCGSSYDIKFATDMDQTINSLQRINLVKDDTTVTMYLDFDLPPIIHKAIDVATNVYNNNISIELALQLNTNYTTINRRQQHDNRTFIDIQCCDDHSDCGTYNTYGITYTEITDNDDLYFDHDIDDDEQHVVMSWKYIPITVNGVYKYIITSLPIDPHTTSDPNPAIVNVQHVLTVTDSFTNQHSNYYNIGPVDVLSTYNNNTQPNQPTIITNGCYRGKFPIRPTFTTH